MKVSKYHRNISSKYTSNNCFEIDINRYNNAEVEIVESVLKEINQTFREFVTKQKITNRFNLNS